MKEDIQHNIDQLLRNKDFSELDSKERDFIEENFGNEDTYSSYREAILMALASRELRPSPAVKAALVSRMKKKNSSILVQVFELKIPAYASLIALVIAISLLWFIRPVEEVLVESVKTIEVPSVPDTIYMESVADTIIMERIVRVKVPVYLSAAKEPEIIPDPEIETMEGSNLSDHKELRSLIVSAP